MDNFAAVIYEEERGEKCPPFFFQLSFRARRAGIGELIHKFPGVVRRN